ncbi:DUF6303 family protein [Streptomyces wuyuanensis]|uniref:Uncharacterized protein n=1 Tax=Streptomyces wuyuanensis TaxID=1196353 RepID=A0A1G9V1M3_9ACTN|nr:DUF6303 family protein [Streptomyces wuyuanensis]SDM65937.1 hypothetical protein SAMN05444921_111164 [Streptomyces wuyuanensis]
MMPTAQMSSSGGPWRLYVALMGSTKWPDYRWERPTPVPTIAERRTVLATLGYEQVPGSEWSWIEDTTTYGDDGSPVLLIAAVEVRESRGGAS